MRMSVAFAIVMVKPFVLKSMTLSPHISDVMQNCGLSAVLHT